MPGLIDRLLARPQGFDLFQALHLLERAEPARQPVGTSLGLDEAVRLCGHTSLGFAPSDIESVQASTRAGPPLTLSSPVMALAGAQGPLPLAYTELLLAAARQRDRASLDFLDIFQQRLLGFLHRGRRKHRVSLALGPLHDVPALRALDALSGLGCAEGARAPGGQGPWLRHAGLQGAAPRSMASLLALLRDRLGIAFGGRCLVGAWHPLAREERACLAAGGGRAAGTALGLGAALGIRAWDPAAGLALSTPPLGPAQFASLLPGGATHALLSWLVGRHLQQDVRVSLQLAVEGVPPTRLGVRGAGRTQAPHGLPPRLGLSAWLCGPRGGGPRGEGARVPPLQGPCIHLATEAAAHGH